MRKQKMEETILDNNTQLDLDEQLPVVEISDKFTKDKLIQNKENKEIKSKKDLINCLRNERIIIRHIPKYSSNITNPKHIFYG